MKSENKELRYELSESLENLKEQATRLQKSKIYHVENGTLKKSFDITKQKPESYKVFISVQMQCSANISKTICNHFEMNFRMLLYFNKPWQRAKR